MNHYKKALEEGEKLFDERFVKIRTNQPVVEGMSTSHYPAVRMTYNNAKSYLTSFAEKIRQAVAEDEYKLLEDYSDWLHKHSYLDSDYYTEEPHAIDAFITHKREQLTKE